MRKQCELLLICRSALYYKPIGETAYNTELMRLMDEYYLRHPSAGVITMQDYLRSLDHWVNIKRIRRLLRLMGLMAIYPKRNLSKLGFKQYVHLYLLKGLTIDRPNKVCAIDITYIPMKGGFMYLTVILDVYSRFVVSWDPTRWKLLRTWKCLKQRFRSLENSGLLIPIREASLLAKNGLTFSMSRPSESVWMAKDG